MHSSHRSVTASLWKCESADEEEEEVICTQSVGSLYGDDQHDLRTILNRQGSTGHARNFGGPQGPSRFPQGRAERPGLFPDPCSKIKFRRGRHQLFSTRKNSREKKRQLRDITNTLQLLVQADTAGKRVCTDGFDTSSRLTEEIPPSMHSPDALVSQASTNAALVDRQRAHNLDAQDQYCAEQSVLSEDSHDCTHQHPQSNPLSSSSYDMSGPRTPEQHASTSSASCITSATDQFQCDLEMRSDSFEETRHEQHHCQSSNVRDKDADGTEICAGQTQGSCCQQHESRNDEQECFVSVNTMTSGVCRMLVDVSPVSLGSMRGGMAGHRFAPSAGGGSEERKPAAFECAESFGVFEGEDADCIMGERSVCGEGVQGRDIPEACWNAGEGEGKLGSSSWVGEAGRSMDVEPSQDLSERTRILSNSAEEQEGDQFGQHQGDCHMHLLEGVQTTAQSRAFGASEMRQDADWEGAVHGGQVRQAYETQHAPDVALSAVHRTETRTGREVSGSHRSDHVEVYMQLVEVEAARDLVDRGTTMELYGRTAAGESVLARVKGFRPYMYVARPFGASDRRWNDVVCAVSSAVRKRVGASMVWVEQVRKQHLMGRAYGAEEDFVKLSFHSVEGMQAATSMLSRPLDVLSSEGRCTMELELMESAIDPVMRFMTDRELVASGWMRVQGTARSGAGRESFCTIEVEVAGLDAVHACSADSLSQDPEAASQASADNSEWSRIAPLSVASIAIAPLGAGLEGGLRLMGVSSLRHGQDGGNREALFVVGEAQQIEGGPVRVTCYRSEKSMLRAWWRHIVEELDPDILMTYDTETLSTIVERMKELGVDAGNALGRIRQDSSVAAGSGGGGGGGASKEMSVRGRVVWNLEALLQREHRLRCFALESVSAVFLGDTEPHLDPSALSELCAGSVADRSTVGLQVSRRAAIPLLVAQKLDMLVNMVEMSRVTGVGLEGLSKRAQQYKVLSQLCRACRLEGFLIPTHRKRKALWHDGDDAHEEGSTGAAYQGATVMEARVGAYSTPICTLDFASLYPSIIIAYNLSYETLIRDEPPADASKYCEFSIGSDAHKDGPRGHDDESPQGWADADVDGDSHRGQGGARGNGGGMAGAGSEAGSRTRFWRRGEVDGREGVLPRILKGLLRARKEAKAAMKREADEEMRRILNGRQLAYKVSSNSLYGFCGATNGYLPCVALAATVTAIGRQLIAQTKAKIEGEFTVGRGCAGDATVVYGDTDSVMVDFHLPSGAPACVEEAMRLGRRAAASVTASFPPPISLEFEKVYCPYLLFSKKRYAGVMYAASGHERGTTDVKGVETVRRDSCLFVQEVYAHALELLLRGPDSAVGEGQGKSVAVRAAAGHGGARGFEGRVQAALEWVRGQVKELLAGGVPMEKLVLSKALTKTTYKAKAAHANLAKRLEQRGGQSSASRVGSRMQYVKVVATGNGAEGLAENAEDPAFVVEQGLQVDWEWYLSNQLKSPLLKLFQVLSAGVVAESLRPAAAGVKHVKEFKAQSEVMRRFVVARQSRCQGCTAPLPKSSAAGKSVLCADCAPDREDFIFAAQAALMESQHRQKALWNKCRECWAAGDTRLLSLCKNVTCSNLYARAEADKDVRKKENELQILEF